MKEWEIRQIYRLKEWGITCADIAELKRLSKRLDSWQQKDVYYHEDKGYFVQQNPLTGAEWKVRDMGTASENKIKAIVAKYPDLGVYFQGDPRGCPVYIFRLKDRGEHSIHSIYSSIGIGICQ